MMEVLHRLFPTGERYDMRPFTALAVMVFALVAAVQLLRVLLGWVVMINGIIIPLWVSVVICLITITLAAMIWREHSN